LKVGERSTCVVHLVWAPLGVSMLEGFLSAYNRYESGLEHELAVIFNGFSGREDSRLVDVKRVLEGIEHECIITPRPVLDLEAYRHAATQLDAQTFCFLNSYSRPLVDGWLAKLAAGLEQPRVGLAGATGSWASPRSWTAHNLGLPSAYAGVLPARRAAIEQFMAIESDHGGPSPQRPVSVRDWMVAGWRRLLELPAQTLPYARFPSYHVRTNAFVISKATLATLRLGSVGDKKDAHLIENGKRSMTRQLQRKGWRTVVVDREGAVFDHPDWHLSRTLWQGDQEGLLVADNQTRTYANADLERRRLLAGYAWGRDADPILPNMPTSPADQAPITKAPDA
jgi:hypothetical protein